MALRWALERYGLIYKRGCQEKCFSVDRKAERFATSSPCHHRRRSPEMEGLFTRDAQAACDFSFSASKFSPFFQSVSVIAASLRASVRRAMVGLMPLASAAW